MPTGYPDPAETVIAQRGYSAWAMLPSFFLCALLSVLFLLSGWLFKEVRGLGENTGSWVLFVVTGIFWALQILRWLYRGASYAYVLTEKRLLVDRGFRWLPTPPIELAEVSRVRWGMHHLSRPFHVGWIAFTTRSGREEVLDGILNPREFAWLVERQLGKLRTAPNVEPRSEVVSA